MFLAGLHGSFFNPTLPARTSYRDVYGSAIIEYERPYGSFDKHSYSIISSAAAFNHGRIVEILLDSGAYLEAKDVLEMTPLLMAVTHGKVEAAKLLLERGADITATDSSLNSALHLAIIYRRPEMVKLLLEMDNDCVLLQMKDKDVKTVLHLAAGLETCEVL